MHKEETEDFQNLRVYGKQRENFQSFNEILFLKYNDHIS